MTDELIAEFDDVPASGLHTLKDGVDRTPAQMLAYQLGWMDLLLDRDELFTSGQRTWASSTPSAWPVAKWVHINTVAPFTSFRTRIRAWKRH